MIICSLVSVGTFAQEVPFPLSPDWESAPESRRSTGLGLADINGDGWKDMIVADGNDMARQHLVVYYNNGNGTFPLSPDWESGDIDYHGHLSVGDVDSDGWPDVAVSVYIGPAGFGEPGKVKVYYNEGGQLESVPSFESFNYYTFSCAFGDADGDGDLDLATTGGEPYSGLFDSGKIFLNNEGVFSNEALWTSSFNFGSLDVDFGDMDQNGYLDVVFASEDTPNYIFLSDESGIISDSAGWTSENPGNFINSLDIGFVGSEKIQAVVMTGNDQLGGDGEVWQFSFPEGVPVTSSADWTSNPVGYGSGILLADVNADDVLDLVYGGWWRPMKIALGLVEGGFEMNPSYISTTSSVVETIQMADLDRDGIDTLTDSFFPMEGIGSVIYLRKQLVENILSVKMNGTLLHDSMFCFVPNKNWISFKNGLQAGDQLEVEYEFSEDADIVISNWDAGVGNYIFYNTLVTGHDEAISMSGGLHPKCWPNPANNHVNIEIEFVESTKLSIRLLNLFGQEVIQKQTELKPAGTYISQMNTAGVPKGLYVLVVKAGKLISSQKLVIN